MPQNIKHMSLAQYMDRVVEIAGTDLAVGRYLGYADGSRVGIWRRNQGRPDELSCVKIARWMGDNPVDVLRISGYTEMADLLDGSVAPTPVSFSALRPFLMELRQHLDNTLVQGEEIEDETKSRKHAGRQAARK